MKASTNLLVAQGAVFSLKFQIAFKLQDIAYQTEDLIEFRKQLVNDIVGKVTELNKKNLAIRQNIKEESSQDENLEHKIRNRLKNIINILPYWVKVQLDFLV